MANKFDPILDKYRQADLATVDTKATLLASTPKAGTLAFATDTSEFFVYDGTNWQVASIKLSIITENPDAGAELNSDKQGYGEDYITDKTLYNVILGGSEREVPRSLRINSATSPISLEFYDLGQWFTLIPLDMETNSELEHTYNTTTYDVWSGNGDIIGINGVPLTQQYQVTAGAYGVPLIIDGGEI